jgi:carbon monoxide dehydrogenase subunit G
MTTKVEKTITVDVPISTAYNQWTQFEEFPQFMGGVQSVEQLDDRRLRWVAEIAGVRREWHADILEQRPDEKIAWAATEGATNAGAVYFIASGPGQTQVTLELEYDPEGLVEKAGDALGLIERQAQSDVERFKEFIESRGAESGSWRGQVGAPAVGTPGVDLASSEGDSGKAGVSPKAAAAGVAAVAAAGVAAAAATRGSSDEEAQVDVVEVTEVEPAVGMVPDPEGMVGASGTDTTPLDDDVAPIDPILGTPAAEDPADGRTG